MTSFTSLSQNWLSWWRTLTPLRKYGPTASILVYWAALAALNGFKNEHALIGSLIVVLSLGGPLGGTVLAFLMPLLLTGILYDSMRYYADYIRGPIHVTEPYEFDKRFFGIRTEQGVLTPNEYWQIHQKHWLDLVTGFFYLIFISLFVAIAAYFRFYLARKGTARMPALELRRKSARTMWAFFWVNMLGYSTYYWYAASPPWYVEKYGFGPARTDVPASTAGCERFDAMLGTNFFSDFYGKAADVHGAIPSLHIAYPLVALYFAIQFGALRLFCLGFFLIMCFSAVYLNHHYILDIIWGSVYAVLVSWLVNLWFDRRDRAGGTLHELPIRQR
jgi:membrane-associated phospholipid phosphatase